MMREYSNKRGWDDKMHYTTWYNVIHELIVQELQAEGDYY